MKYCHSEQSEESPEITTLIYEDKDILVVEKPVGLAVYPQKNATHDSLAQHLVKNFPELKKLQDWGAVHRLDVETSGLVVFARNESCYQKLRMDFSQNRAHKEYQALVTGNIPKKGRIDFPIGPDPKTSKKVRVYRNLAEARRHKAQEAVTMYDPVSVGANLRVRPQSGQTHGSAPTTLLNITIKTGRRHQIRVHLAAIGHPIVGDKLYGGPPVKRLHLHATGLVLIHPTTGKKLELSSKW